MNSRLLSALIVGAYIFAAGATADAQSPADSANSYDGRALRFESSWGNVRIIRGADGQVIGTSGWFRDAELEKIVAGSPSAIAQARLYEKDNFRGSLVGTVGALATVVGLVLTTNSSNSASSPALVIGGVGALLWGAQHLTMSYSALSRALWWYNRDLPR